VLRDVSPRVAVAKQRDLPLDRYLTEGNVHTEQFRVASLRRPEVRDEQGDMADTVEHHIVYR
jgi:hypothetical protein